MTTKNAIIFTAIAVTGSVVVHELVEKARLDGFNKGVEFACDMVEAYIKSVEDKKDEKSRDEADQQ